MPFAHNLFGDRSLRVSDAGSSHYWPLLNSAVERFETRHCLFDFIEERGEPYWALGSGAEDGAWCIEISASWSKSR